MALAMVSTLLQAIVDWNKEDGERENDLEHDQIWGEGAIHE